MSAYIFPSSVEHGGNQFENFWAIWNLLWRELFPTKFPQFMKDCVEGTQRVPNPVKFYKLKHYFPRSTNENPKGDAIKENGEVYFEFFKAQHLCRLFLQKNLNNPF